MKPEITNWKDPTSGVMDGHSIKLISKDKKVTLLMSARKANLVIENLKYVKQFAKAYKQ